MTTPAKLDGGNLRKLMGRLFCFFGKHRMRYDEHWWTATCVRCGRKWCAMGFWYEKEQK